MGGKVQRYGGKGEGIWGKVKEYGVVDFKGFLLKVKGYGGKGEGIWGG
jgi:hypothetical protein